MANTKKENSGAHVDRSAQLAREQKKQAAAAEKARIAAEKQAEKDRIQAEKDRKAAEKQAAKEAKEEARRVRAKKAAARRRKAWKTIRVVLIVVLILGAVLAGGATYAGYRVSNSLTNMPNVSVEGIPVGGLTQEQTAQRLGEQGWDEEAAVKLKVELPEGVSFELDRCLAGAMMTKEAAAEAAFRYGHSDNWYEDLLRYVRGHIVPTDVSAEYLQLDQDYIRGEAEKAVAEFEKKTALEGDAFTVDREKNCLRFVKGAGEQKIDLDALCAEIAAAFENKQTLVDHRHIDNELTPPDFEAIYQELAVEPRDAHWIENTWEVEEEVVGCTFDIQKALELWEKAKPNQTVEIPLTITEPEVTAESLKSMLFRDKLGAQTSYYTGSNSNRVNNINLAVSKINGTVLLPGETFSYNETVGERTTEAGFLEAGAYLNGEVVQEIGGGICQVSSTTYCATLYAQLQITSRESHYFRVDYLPWGQDATVSWPKPDFKFTNNRDYPIKIVAYCDNDARALTVEIWGTDTDGTYIELTHDRYVVTDDTWGVVIGWNVYSWANVYDADGTFLRSYELPASTYFKHEWEIEWPPEKDNPPASEGGGDGGDGGSDATVVIDP